MRVFCAALALGAGACALGPGAPYGQLQVTVDGGFAPLSDRDRGAGWQQLNTDFQVRVSSATLELVRVDLLEAATTQASNAAPFDPQRPPPGYSLCHGGHCHRDDGALVPYDEIETGGGAGTTRPVLTLGGGGALSLLPGTPVRLTCLESCDLPRTRLTRARLTLAKAAIEGEVRDGRSPARLAGEAAFSFSYPEPLVLTVPLSESFDRTTPAQAALLLSFAPTVRMFDDVAWGALTRVASGLVINEANNSGAAKSFYDALTQVPLTVQVDRADHLF